VRACVCSNTHRRDLETLGEEKVANEFFGREREKRESVYVCVCMCDMTHPRDLKTLRQKDRE